MERKTQVHTEDGKQELVITREFDLPVALLFKAYEEPAIVEQWMGTKVLKLESKQYGSYEFETTDPKGTFSFRMSGVIHAFVPNSNITRTFEMNNAAFGAQLEFLDFEAVTETTSRLRMQIVYKSVDVRDQVLRLPFAQGINMAHNRLQDIADKLKTTV